MASTTPGRERPDLARRREGHAGDTAAGVDDASEVDDATAGAPAVIDSVLGLLRRKWVVPILRELRDGPLRFFQIRLRVKGVQPKVLRDTLRFLEREGLVARVLHDDGTGSKSIAYALTDLGRSLDEPLTSVYEWGLVNLKASRSA